MKTLLTLLLLIPSLSWGKMISIKDYINSVSDLKNNEMFYLTARCNSLHTIIEGVSNGYPEINRHFFPKKYYFGETEYFDFIGKIKCYS